MLEIKQLGALFMIAAGGFINAGIDSTIALPAQAPRATIDRRVDAMPSEQAMRAAAQAALLAQLRADLGDPSASLELGTLGFVRDSGRGVEGRGNALARFDGGAVVPLEVSVAWDLPTQRIEQASYLLSGPAPTLALDAQLRKRIADRIGARLVIEFAGQPVDFALQRVEHFAAGRERMLVSGEGVASFGAEGAARTRFLATAERSTGKLLTLQYELREQLAP
jgi:hypothetical protein